MCKDNRTYSYFKFNDGYFIDMEGNAYSIDDEKQVREFIRAVNKAYDRCDDERIRNNDDANEEYWKRDAIVGEVNYLASNANRDLGVLDEGTSSYYECMGKIKVLNRLQMKIKEVLD